VKYGWTAILLITGIAGDASAASFDCAKASLPIEKTICADPALSKADEALAAAWRASLAASLDKPALRNDQGEWLRGRTGNASELTSAYRERIDALNDLAGKWSAMPRVFAVDDLKKTCFVTPEADASSTCQVDESGKVEGDDKLFYQLRSFHDGDLRTSGGAVVFEAPSLTPLVGAYGDSAHYDRPKVVTPPVGTLLWIPGYLEGTGNFSAEQLYAWRDGSWQDIDIDSWKAEMARRLSGGLYVAKGIFPDYRAMTAATPIWRPIDGNCCPTAGRAVVRLGLKDRRLTITDMRVTLGRAAAEAQ